MVMCLKGLRLTGWEDIYAKSVVAQRIQHGSAGITEELNIQKQTLKSINWLFFAVIRNSKVLPKGLILGKSATEINKMSRETMDEVLKSLDFEKIRSWYDGKRGEI